VKGVDRRILLWILLNVVIVVVGIILFVTTGLLLIILPVILCGDGYIIFREWKKRKVNKT
jgi:nicotinamide riboside transporter PnuC